MKTMVFTIFILCRLLLLSFVPVALADVHIPDRDHPPGGSDHSSDSNIVSIDSTITKSLQGITPSIPSFSANSTEKIYSDLSKKLKFARNCSHPSAIYPLPDAESCLANSIWLRGEG
ncbi:MAG: hypothetical protein HQK52_23590 [Oligoflexia bacterium]|nr:hypothetical protein [Oligoflexia bacterium]